MAETQDPSESGYPTHGKLEMIWAEGFLSPGCEGEVVWIIADHDISGCSVLEIGCGLGGAAVLLLQRCGASRVTGFDVQSLLADRASDRARDLGLADRLTFVVRWRVSCIPVAASSLATG
jgi:methylase of polypeptide subunit release factors